MLNNRHYRKVLMVYLSIGVIGVIGVLFLQSGMASTAGAPAVTDDSMEILTRGPVHEAFAEVSVDEAQPGTVVSIRDVPDPINEIPPDVRPEGDNIQWISGYWSWDEDQDDFIWVSGIWRDVPPGRQWISGYWTQVEGGYQYISGFWTESNQSETVYLPPPPKPLQATPGSPAVSPSHIWIEGHWVWLHGGYAWQTGYWLEQRPDMVWIPAHYAWTPRGYIFIGGYWDYQLSRRGVLFAPRYYVHPIYRNHGYYYTPSIVLNIDTISLSLFIRRDSHHYYFGDYFDVRYEKRGFHPWYSPHATRYGYDPYYRSYRLHRLQKDKQWENNYQRQFQYSQKHKEARPPVFYRPPTKHNVDRSHNRTNQMIGEHLTDIMKRKDQAPGYIRMNSEHKRKFLEQDQKTTAFKTKRREFESVKEPRGKSWKQPQAIQRPVQPKTSVSSIKSGHTKTWISSRPQGKYSEKKHEIQKQQPQTQPQLKMQDKWPIIQHEQPKEKKYRKSQEQAEQRPWQGRQHYQQQEQQKRGERLKKDSETKNGLMEKWPRRNYRF